VRDSLALREQTRASLEELADAVDRRDAHTEEHSRRVAALARAIAEALDLPAARVEAVELAARLHDIGKIGVKTSILSKPEPLTETEWREVHRHPEAGAQLIAGFPELVRGGELVRAHHEWFDGSGYPRGVAGERIPLGARVIAVADAWETLTAGRPWRWPLPPQQARAELERGRGTQFDPVVLDAFARALAAHPELAAPDRPERRGTTLPRLRPLLPDAAADSA
jgi:HD-GYP domain-containing protein (c-di-GMP phosphodiesterase class II)